jgi:hypothetical protein
VAAPLARTTTQSSTTTAWRGRRGATAARRRSWAGSRRCCRPTVSCRQVCRLPVPPAPPGSANAFAVSLARCARCAQSEAWVQRPCGGSGRACRCPAGCMQIPARQRIRGGRRRLGGALLLAPRVSSRGPACQRSLWLAGFDKFVEFAKEHDCPVNHGYAQIMEDLAAFRDPANPTRRTITKARARAACVHLSWLSAGARVDRHVLCGAGRG